MQNIEIPLPPAAPSDDTVRVIEAALTKLDLEITLRGTLKKFPGCMHWHARSAGRSGTVEVTFWPQSCRVWLTVQSGRTANWITARLPEVQSVLARHLAVGSRA